jgi:hypothetical protein
MKKAKTKEGNKQATKAGLYQWVLVLADRDVGQVDGDALLRRQVVLSSLARLTDALCGRAIARQVNAGLRLELPASETD